MQLLTSWSFPYFANLIRISQSSPDVSFWHVSVEFEDALKEHPVGLAAVMFISQHSLLSMAA
jgi:hypothetical protein